MKVLHRLDDLVGAFQKPVVTIGTFDGIHVGHQYIVSQLSHMAYECEVDSVLITFDIHPLRLLAPEKCPPSIQSNKQKIEILKKTGLSGVVILPFSREIADMEAEAFIEEILVRKLNTSKVLIGENFIFGRRRKGDYNLLVKMGKKLGYQVGKIKLKKIRGQIVSSTLIRRLIGIGKVENVIEYLGHPYTIDGMVVEGQRLGRSLGFPTANIHTENDLFMPYGVYAVVVEIGKIKIVGVANFGIRPTVSDEFLQLNNHPILETYLPGFSSDIYGEQVKVYFHSFIRKERKFPSVGHLVQQMEEDITRCKQYFKIN